MKVRVASAGTGKTASLVLRYLELISSGTPLRRIGGITFTRKAADELRVRVGWAIEEVIAQGRHLDFCLAGSPEPFREAQREISGATITTIHGFMGQCLRLAAPLIHLDPDFSILGDWEARTLFEEEWQSLLYLAAEPSHLLHGVAMPGMGEDLLHLFSRRSLVERYLANDETSRDLLRVYEAVYSAYEARLRANLLSPSELERRAIELTRRPKALERVLERIQILLVDEYQDVNPLQGAFFEALERWGLPIEIVGDPKQSIYAFRNAEVAVFRKALLEGERQTPLTHSYRHAQTLIRFLNRLTGALAQEGLGFAPDEAPEVEGVRTERGRLEIHWIDGEATLDEMRAQEAWVLAQQLLKLSQTQPFSDMAVLVRSYGSAAFLEHAFEQSGIPYILLQGRGYYERQEVRDLFHALRTALDPRGVSLAAWLRSPFAALRLDETERILRAENPLLALEVGFPLVFERLQKIRAQVRLASPLGALKYLLREPLIAGRAYQDFLEARARENVDALLFQFAPRPPQSLEALLDRLELLSDQSEAGDVPQSGEGVQILTVHRAKGLEWPVVAVFDLGRKQVHQGQPLYLERGGLPNAEAPVLQASFAQPNSPSFERLRAEVKALEEEESYRLLYVAASRAKDVLLLTGSVREGKADGWASVLSRMNLGPGSPPFDRPDFVHKTWMYRPLESAPKEKENRNLEPSPWVEQSFPVEPFPPLFSPSGLKREEHEPLPLPDPNEGEEIPGRSRAIGTLVHYAIGQNWDPGDPRHLANLEAQEVMFPFNPDERDGIMLEVKELLQKYQSLLGHQLPWPRDEDYPEFGMAIPKGTTVWQGVIDRLYRVGEQWYLEDYKTDLEVSPERYRFQLGIYLEAIRQAWGIEPEVRLVFLRFGEVFKFENSALETALEEVFTR